jgi:hypothetical protein
VTERHAHEHEEPHKRHRHHHHPHGTHPHPKGENHHHVFTPKPPPEPTCEGVKVTGDLQREVILHPEGTTFCLEGTYELRVPLLLKHGQSLVGPATIVASGDVQFGIALKNRSTTGVTLKDLDMSGFAENAVQGWGGLTVIGGRYHHNLQTAFGFGMEYQTLPVVIDGAEVDHNGSEEFLGHNAGGIKVARLGGVFEVRNCDIHDNFGNGVWADVQCVGNYFIHDNTVYSNGRKGIHYEKSGASDEVPGSGTVQGEAHIERNTVYNNGLEGRESAADGGIVNVSSRNWHVRNNTTYDNRRGGIFVRQDGRLSGEKHGWQCHGSVIDNDVNDGYAGDGWAGIDRSG